VAIAKGVMHADRGAGVLLCVSNHSGDVLNAEMALEMRVSDDVDCRVVILGDDVSSSDDPADRRGGPGLFFAWKIIGAAAEAGYDLEDCARIASSAVSRTGSLSATIRGTVNPTTGQETTKVPDGQILVGTGVHGDGTGTLLDWCTARELAGAMVEPLVSAISLGDGDRVLTMVNDAGAMSVAETALVHSGVLKELQQRGVDVVGSWVGRYATTLATAGLAVAILKLDDELLRLWRAPCRAPALCSWGAGPVG
jgi:dihydroxyacetone kinase